jgi:hypothetical protein
MFKQISQVVHCAGTTGKYICSDHMPRFPIRASINKVILLLTIATERRTNDHGTIMKPAIIIGILLIIVGFVGFSLGGFSFTHEKQDIDAGPIQIGHEQKKTLPIRPL